MTVGLEKILGNRDAVPKLAGQWATIVNSRDTCVLSRLHALIVAGQNNLENWMLRAN